MHMNAACYSSGPIALIPVYKWANMQWRFAGLRSADHGPSYSNEPFERWGDISRGLREFKGGTGPASHCDPTQKMILAQGRSNLTFAAGRNVFNCVCAFDAYEPAPAKSETRPSPALSSGPLHFVVEVAMPPGVVW
ncbi:MAG TPA: hypothetical protein V6D17_18130 [Candidatus Obscuribacterales bacterium]